jgi:selenide,water dikinase
MGALAHVLRSLPKVRDPNLLVGSDHFDDAGVFRLDAHSALVLTVDFFPPLIDDPYQFGRIAAANSLSDVYAMGGHPLAVLNIVGFPDKDLPTDILADILRGGAERVAAAGAVVAGGHSVRDAEIKYGLAVTGLVHPDRILTNGGARPGDVLILTKPIGSGILTTAAKKGLIPENDLNEAIEVMVELNAGACDAIRELAEFHDSDPNAAGVHAATDITGFGLLGHAFEMAEASGVTIEIQAAKVPLMTGALRLAGKGALTRAHKSNLEHVGDRLSAESADETLVNVLADAQTSGGLLIAVSEHAAPRLMDRLKYSTISTPIIVGSVRSREMRSILVV